MERVDFKFKRGISRTMNVKAAQLLEKLGYGTYMTRDMTAAKPPVVVVPDLDSMSREELHALAKERGIYVHHMAGAEKVRAALKGA